MVRSRVIYKKLALVMMIMIVVTIFGPTRSFAVNPDEVLSDPALEQRARNLSSKLRCLVCQNQSIDDSDASLAKDLRILLRKRLVAGDTDGDVMDYIVSRYGEFVLLQPRFGIHTLILWSMPVLLILIGILVFFIRLKRVTKSDTLDLTDEENARITKLLGEGEGGKH